MRARFVATLLAIGATNLGCSSNASHSRFPTTDAGLGLSRVVLYRNGVGYFERQGEVDGDTLRIKVRKDQINDLLKSLTVIDRKSGQAVSVSMPLEPHTWAAAALSMLSPGRGSLADVLDSMRGHRVRLATTQGTVAGRVVMVERIENEPDPAAPKRSSRGGDSVHGSDHKVTLMHEKNFKVVRLSKVKGVTIDDGDLALQFHRRLDASAGEGMFQQVDVAIRLLGGNHDVMVSYVVEAPMWKPTYRIVLPEKGKGDALLQAWAVVDNLSGEDWSDVKLALTAGAPIAFRYDLHSPRIVGRQDVTRYGNTRRARVSMGETTFGDLAKDKNAPPAERKPMRSRPRGATASADAPGMPPPAPAAKAAWGAGKRSKKKGRRRFGGGMGRNFEPKADFKMAEAEEDLDDSGGFIDLEGLRRSTRAQARASQASGLNRFDIANKVTIPDGTSTMVALINQTVKGEETFMYKPGVGGGRGFENNPYRVVRFKNTTPFALEPGPISIYSAGSFVGEGVSETVGAGSSVTVPFAVEAGITVERENRSIPQEVKLLKIVRGVMHIERFRRHKTKWTVKTQTKKDGFTVLIRHPQHGYNFKLFKRPEGTEDLVRAYLVPLKVAPGQRTGSVEVIEQTPARTTIRIASYQALKLLEKLLIAPNLTAEQRAKLEPIVKIRQRIGKIDSEMSSQRRKKREFEQMMSQTRRNLRSIEKDKSAQAGALRRDQQKQLDEFSKKHNAIGRKLVELESEKRQLSIRMGDMMRDLTILEPPQAPKKK